MITYTINSTDPEHYNRINITLPNNTNWQHAIETATSLATQCNMIVLEENLDKFIIEYYVPNNEHISVDVVSFQIIITRSNRNFENFDEVVSMLNHYLVLYECPGRAGRTNINTIKLISTNNQVFYILI
jgi:hypothetical protein